MHQPQTSTLAPVWQDQPESGTGSLGEPAFGILIADDEPAVRTTLAAALTRHGFQVTLAGDGEEALALFARHWREIHLVLLDVRMPRRTGPEVMAAIQQIHPEVCCCFMTGYMGEHSEEELLARGARHIFAKPFRLSEMIATLQAFAGQAIRLRR